MSWRFPILVWNQRSKCTLSFVNWSTIVSFAQVHSVSQLRFCRSHLTHLQQPYTINHPNMHADRKEKAYLALCLQPSHKNTLVLTEADTLLHICCMWLHREWPTTGWQWYHSPGRCISGFCDITKGLFPALQVQYNWKGELFSRGVQWQVRLESLTAS